MSNSVEARLSTLEDLITEQNAKLHKGLSTTIIVYIILVVFVLGYTTWVTAQLTARTSRAEVAAMIGAQLGEQLPIHRKKLMDQLEANSHQLAKDLVDHLVQSIPALENHLHQLLDAQTDNVIAQMKGHIMPAFSTYLKEEAPDLEAKYADLSDEEVMQGVVHLFTETIESELDQYVNKTLVRDMEELQIKINRLGNPKTKLTKMEDSQRRVIMYWAYLNEVSEVGESPLESLFKELNERYRFFSAEDMEQLKTPIVDEED